MAIRYSITKDKAFCAYCICFGGTKNIPGASSSSSNFSPFVSCGFSNWKKATGKDNYIDHHMLSEAHHTAEEMVYCFLSTRQPGKDIVARLSGPCKFVINWRTTNYNCFLSCKDKTPGEYKSSVVYEFSCPGCRSSYIGKTDRCLYTRIKEHSTRENSEIYAHVNLRLAR